MNNTKPINYSYLAGTLMAKLDMLAYRLESKGLINPEQIKAIREFCDKEIKDAEAQEREYTG